MNLYCIKCAMFIKNSNIKIKCEIDGKIKIILITLTVVLKSLK